ncbi:hypothetical protein GPALN_014378 [Globodera pallida]|nr:hypothetical protein GPALN_014378 [Globodera pallida]
MIGAILITAMAFNSAVHANQGVQQPAPLVQGAQPIIHCDDNLVRKTVPVPPNGTHLRGFSVLSLTNNNIDELPDEPLLLAKFPGLKRFILLQHHEHHSGKSGKAEESSKKEEAPSTATTYQPAALPNNVVQQESTVFAGNPLMSSEWDYQEPRDNTIQPVQNPAKTPYQQRRAFLHPKNQENRGKN